MLVHYFDRDTGEFLLERIEPYLVNGNNIKIDDVWYHCEKVEHPYLHRKRLIYPIIVSLRTDSDKRWDINTGKIDKLNQEVKRLQEILKQRELELDELVIKK